MLACIYIVRVWARPYWVSLCICGERKIENYDIIWYGCMSNTGFSLLFVRVLPLYRQRINKEGMYIIILQIIMQTT